ncbi:hypothetical protein F5J12DRAFT_790770 [Pisolithus orientalis]|uniref:uncharacterized protein n=1 Tax=Pisolithus orientalis TaxID=936130 RepID=UPI002224E1D0|nr:uncharacterized protein F5J12DRAFT_790770 [Pisolithus orientalis]KAI6035058.1 hypothetical protein F5J12DRAFT_790770 [Pisolithus orientalis]
MFRTKVLTPCCLPSVFLRGLRLRGSMRWKHSALVEDVHADAPFRIPLIDFSCIPNCRQVADDIVDGFKEVGFIYLTGHGIQPDVIENVYKKSAEFFKLPQHIKDQVAWDDPRANRGYVKVGRERVTQSSDAEEIAALRKKSPDMKETMEIGRDWDPVWKNKWPKEIDVPGFKDTMLQFFRTCHELHTVVMRSVALGLDLPEDFFEDKINQQSHNLRLLSYPPMPARLLTREGQARAGAHSDYGTLTLLFQDSVGGLEVQNPRTQDFQPAPPIPGTVVVNAGDLLARWSNNTLRSTLHRVVAPFTSMSNTGAAGGMTPARQSIAFFCNPNFDAIIESLPACVSTSNPSKYPPVTTEQYIVRRLAETYD